MENVLTDAKAGWFYKLAGYLSPETAKEMIVDVATEPVAILLPCEAQAIIAVLELTEV